MSQEPPPVLVIALKGSILDIFDISDEGARVLATKIAATGEWGTDENPSSALDWQYRLKQELGEKLPWRSEAARERFRLDEALSRHLRPPTFNKLILQRDWQALSEAARKIMQRRRASDAEVQMMKAIATPAGAIGLATDAWRVQTLRMECLTALLAAGLGRDAFVLNRLQGLAEDYLSGPRSYNASPFGLVALVASNDESAVPALRSALEKARSWSIRLGCLYALPESKHDGNYSLLEEFRTWLEQAPEPSSTSHDALGWPAWRTFVSSLKLEGLMRLSGEEMLRLRAPSAHNSPLLDWVSRRGMDNWLLTEAQWLRQRGSGADETPLRNRLVERAAPGIIDFCMERVKRGDHERSAHDDTDSLLKLYPRPLPEPALSACHEIARMRCHPEYFQQRIRALQLLVEGSGLGKYSKEKTVALVVDLSKHELDPDVRAAAIGFIPWTNTKNPQGALADALGHESSRIRDAAEKALAAVNQSKF
jgi:hypothetical protein